MTPEERAINALPEAYRQKMARYCLDGWKFELYDTRVVKFWFVSHDHLRSHTSNTLLTLLDIITVCILE